jgi:homoserine O-acetyltransferase
MNIYRHNQPFELERGGILPELTIAFSTYGKLNAAHDNVIWVCHALTADSDVASWWPHTVEAGKFLDPTEHFIICANILGSHYGTTGPLHVNPATGRPYYKDFPELTIYTSFNPPRWLCRVGDFRSIEEADAMMRRLKATGMFKEVSIVRDQINIPL